MRSFHVSWIVLLTAVLAGSLASRVVIVNRDVGEEFQATILTLHFEVEECYITTPFMQTIHFKPYENVSDKYLRLEDTDLMRCGVIVRNLEPNDTGLWVIHAVTPREVLSESFNVTVNSPPGSDQEITTTPIPEEEEVRIINLDEEQLDTELGSSHRFVIPTHDFVNVDDCYIITPDELRINLASLNISGIEIIRDANVACGVFITVEESLIGHWILVSRETRWSTERRERKLPFIIQVTEGVNAIPNKISVIENKDFYIRLENTITNPETCRLLKPDGKEQVDSERDSRYIYRCGFVIRNVNMMDNGTWHILHGDRVTYSAPIKVTILPNGAQDQNQNRIFNWTMDQPVQEIIGSDETIYCKITDPKGFVVFEGFGRCNITLPRATFDHDGQWRMFIGLRGRVRTEESVFTVEVSDKSPKAVVKTNVTKKDPVVTLSCSVTLEGVPVVPYPFRACKFRTPSGRILMANPGVGEDHYTFHGKGSSYKSGVLTHDCGIQINNPRDQDLGSWRCAIDTRNETYYGFLTAVWPWAWRDPEIAADFVTEPTLTADRRWLQAIAGDSVLMSCSVQSAIRYCYFRTSNGTVYNVGPGGSSTDMAIYAGAGLDAGECSIRFRSLDVADSGRWSCHVGFYNLDMPEQRAIINVDIRDIMIVTQTVSRLQVLVEGRQLDYCRFVRADGFGFTSDAVPAQYFVSTFLHVGECTLFFTEELPLNNHPWTVVTRITGHNQEITRTTDGSLRAPPPPQPFPPRVRTLWLVLLVTGLVLILASAMMVPKKNRRWTSHRMSSMRQSFRHRFATKAVNQENVTGRNTANAA